jgi:hypothetical protein
MTGYKMSKTTRVFVTNRNFVGQTLRSGLVESIHRSGTRMSETGIRVKKNGTQQGEKWVRRQYSDALLLRNTFS